ncbi:hypothetical protein ACFX13_042961 [Malus domestica]
MIGLTNKIKEKPKIGGPIITRNPYPRESHISSSISISLSIHAALPLYPFQSFQSSVDEPKRCHRLHWCNRSPSPTRSTPSSSSSRALIRTRMKTKWWLRT